MKLFFFGVTFRMIVEDAAGTTVIATTREASRQNETESAIGTRSSLTVPVVKTMGRKTQTVVSVEAMIAPETCFAPCTAARGAGSPRPRRRKIFSMTTIELSTSMPMPSPSPDRVMMLSESFEKYIRTTANRTDSGIAIATRKVGRMSFRKTARTMIASSAPRPIFFTISSTISAMYSPWSISVTTVVPSSSSMIRLMAAEALPESSLVPTEEFLKMERTTAGSPFSFA